VYRSSRGDALAISRGVPSGRFYYQLASGENRFIHGDELVFAPVRCGADGVFVTNTAGKTEVWPQVKVRETPTEFVRDGLTFNGLLIEPVDTAGKPPLIIMGHGSEESGVVPVGGAIRTDAYLFAAANGISAFIYDKRGTGKSGGKFIMNFPKLADDMVAASKEARRLAAGRYSRFGFWGPSQGGWIAPLAATNAGADFVVVSFGLAASPHEEERDELLAELTDQGFAGEDIKNAAEVIDAAVAVVASRYTKGYRHLARVKQKFGRAPWYGKLGSQVGKVLKATERELKARAGETGIELDWYYDSLPVLRSSSVPMLWIVAGKDREAPPEKTLERLTRLQGEGKPIQVALFPDTDHGMWEFIQSPDGTRTRTRITESYQKLMADWINGRLSPPYGRATFIPPVKPAGSKTGKPASNGLEA
jgi:pimeloyl-ACP methyl ester carboxylesterase